MLLTDPLRGGTPAQSGEGGPRPALADWIEWMICNILERGAIAAFAAGCV